MIRVAVMTDEPLVAAGFRMLLNAATGFDVIGVCSTAAEVCHVVRKHNPDLLLCELFPEMEEEILADLPSAAPRCGIVIRSRNISPDFAHQALLTGIRGFIESRMEPDAIRECLRSVARGELWMEPSLARAMLDTRRVSLTRRQEQIVKLLVQGLKNKEIAGALGIAETTVKAYLTALFEKVGAKDRFELALFGLKNLRSIQDQDATPGVPVRKRPSYVVLTPVRLQQERSLEMRQVMNPVRETAS